MIRDNYTFSVCRIHCTNDCEIDRNKDIVSLTDTQLVASYVLGKVKSFIRHYVYT